MFKSILAAVLWLIGRGRSRDRVPRQLFRYWDGERTRHADPVLAWELLEREAGEDWTDLLKLLSAPPPPGTVGEVLKMRQRSQQAAAKKLADAATQAFGIEPTGDADGTPTGLSVAERIALIVKFLDYIGGLAVMARPFTISPSATAASQAGSPASN